MPHKTNAKVLKIFHPRPRTISVNIGLSDLPMQLHEKSKYDERETNRFRGEWL